MFSLAKYLRPLPLLAAFAWAAPLAVHASVTPPIPTNPDPGAAPELTSLTLWQIGPTGDLYDPLVSLPERSTVKVIPDRQGVVKLRIKASFTGTATAILTDAEGLIIESYPLTSGTSHDIAVPTATVTYPLRYRLDNGTPATIWTTTVVRGGSSAPFQGPGFIGDPMKPITLNGNSVPGDIGPWISLGSSGPSAEGDAAEGSSSCQSCSSCDLIATPTNPQFNYHSYPLNTGQDSGATTNPGEASADIPAGNSWEGTSSTHLAFRNAFTTDITVDDFSVQGSGDEVISRTSTTLTVKTGSGLTKLRHLGTTPESTEVTFYSDPNDTSGAWIRKTVFVKDSITGEIQMTTTHGGKDIKTIWRRHFTSGAMDYAEMVEGNGLHKTRYEYVVNPGVSKKITKTCYEKSAAPGAPAEASVVVSSTITTYNWMMYSWYPVKEEITGNAGGSNLVTTWQWYDGSAASEARGQIKEVRYPNGLVQTHTYVASGTDVVHAITANFADGQTQVESRTKHPGGNLEVETKIGVNTVSKWTESWNHTGTTTDVLTRKEYLDSTHFLATTTVYEKFGTDFGGRRNSVTRPDGTKTFTSTSRTPPSGTHSTQAITIQEGAASGSTITYGKQSITTLDENGVVLNKTVTVLDKTGASGTAGPQNGVLLFKVDTSDPNEDRPQTFTFFAGTGSSWTEKATYGCCNLSSYTNKLGVTTYYDYDDLQRQVKVNSTGVTTATVYDGDTIQTHRYAETSTSASSGWSGITAGRQISSYTRNASNTVRITSGVSPDSGALIEMSRTTVTYANPQGPSPVSLGTNIGEKDVTEQVHVGDDGSSSDHPVHTTEIYAGGQAFRSYGNLRPGQQYVYAANGTGFLTTGYALEGTGATTTTHESSSSQTNWAGLTTATTSSAAGTTTYGYNGLGQCTTTTDADSIGTTYEYNTRGQLVKTTTGDYATFSEEVYATHHTSSGIDYDVIRTVRKGWNDSGAEVVLSYSDHTPDGLRSWETQLPLATGVACETSFLLSLPVAPSVLSSEKTVYPNGQTRKTTFAAGLVRNDVLWSNEGASGGTVNFTSPSVDLLRGTTYSYDSIIPNRILTTQDLRIGSVTYAYFSAVSDFVTSVTLPAAPGGSARVTSYTYDHRGRKKTTKLPGWTSGAPGPYEQKFVYYMDGKLADSGGGQMYHTLYSYDYADRMNLLITFSEDIPLPQVPQFTSWSYDTAGRLQFKTDHNSQSVTYSYTSGGRLHDRTWARLAKTLYGYDTAGRVNSKKYFTSSGVHDPLTPDIGYHYDKLGRLDLVTKDGANHFAYTFDAAKLTVATESQVDAGPGMTYFPRVLTRATDNKLRPGGYKMGTTADEDAISQLTYDYSDYGRLHQILYQATPGAGSPPPAQQFTYSYNFSRSGSYDTFGSGRSSLMPFALDSMQVGTTNFIHQVKTYESNRNVLSSIANLPTGGSTSSYTYTVNDLGQRTSMSRVEAGSTAETMSWGYDDLGQVTSAASAADPTNDSRYYSYDRIGNRRQSRTGTSTSSGGTTTNYYGSSGTAGANSINQYDKINDGTDHILTYDADGNMTNNGYGWTYVWDGENRLVHAYQPATLGNADIWYEYDYLGRMCSRSEAKVFTPPHFASVGAFWYTYDGWNRIESQSSNDLLRDEYVWGLDLSGSRRGAGGAGGMLMWHGTFDGYVSSNYLYYPLYDGNGNVTHLTNSSGSSVAQWEYDAFGNTIYQTPNSTVATDPVNWFEFAYSTKYKDRLLGLYDFGDRFYESTKGRWLSRDPSGENEAENLYCYVSNSPVNNVDILGNKERNITIYVDPEPMPESNGVLDKGETEIRDNMEKRLKEQLRRDGVDEKVLPVKGVSDANSKLKDALTDGCCLKKLEIEGHGRPGYQTLRSTMVGKQKEALWAWTKNGETHLQGFDLFANVKFCKDCMIVMRGCNVGRTKGGTDEENSSAILLAAWIANVTGCTVYAFQDYNYTGSVDTNTIRSGPNAFPTLIGRPVAGADRAEELQKALKLQK